MPERHLNGVWLTRSWKARPIPPTTAGMAGLQSSKSEPLDFDLHPGFWTVLNWKIPAIIGGPGYGVSDEEIEVQRGADCLCVDVSSLSSHDPRVRCAARRTCGRAVSATSACKCRLPPLEPTSRTGYKNGGFRYLRQGRRTATIRVQSRRPINGSFRKES